MARISNIFSSKPSFAGDPLAESLAELCRKATSKNLRAPDEHLKQQIVQSINNSNAQAMVAPKTVSDILIRRLQMDKPHKQELAVDLVRKVLADCAEKLRMYRPELLNEVGRVAFKPNTNGTVEAQRAAKKAAIDYLQSQGAEGQNALRMACGRFGGGGPRSQEAYAAGAYFQTAPNPQASSPMHQGSSPAARSPAAQQTFVPTGDVIADVKQLIEVANGHSEVLEELITASRNLGDESNPLIKELLAEVNNLKQIFPELLEKLSTKGSPEAEALMAQALQASDVLDNCLALQDTAKGGLTPSRASVADGAASPGGQSAKSAPAPVPAPAAPSPQKASAPPADFDLLSFDAPVASGDASASGAPRTSSAADPFGMADLALGMAAPAGGPEAASSAAPGGDPFGNPFAAAGTDGRAPEAAAASNNPFATNLPPASATPPFGSPPPPYGQPNPFNPSAYPGNAFQARSQLFGPAAFPSTPQQMMHGYPLPPAGQPPYPNQSQQQIPGYMQPQGQGYPQFGGPQQQQPGMHAYAPSGYPAPAQAPVYNGGFQAAGAPAPNPFNPQMPGLPAAPAHLPPAPGYIANAFDDLLSVSKRSTAGPSAPMTAPMKPMAGKPATRNGAAAAGTNGQHAAPSKASDAAVAPPTRPPPEAVDPFDLLVAQSSR